jgi:phage baseplate assembly protein W
MTGDFLGIGWSFPVQLENGSMAMARHEDSIRQSIEIILGTAKGERMMRPDFGCGIHDLVFAINSASTAGRVAGEVREALLQWEPRIDVLDVQVGPGVQAGMLVIRIDYRVRTTNNAYNLVYPFYLERGAT